jgi:hypothetical protein
MSREFPQPLQRSSSSGCTTSKKILSRAQQHQFVTSERSVFARRARKIATNYYPTTLFKEQKEIAALLLVSGQKNSANSTLRFQKIIKNSRIEFSISRF